MKKQFWKIVNTVIDEADVLLEVLDARLIEETSNIEIEKKVFEAKKPLIYVLNKCDLIEKVNFSKTPYVLMSSKDAIGIKKIKRTNTYSREKTWD